MATADEFLSQYEPNQQAVNADDFLAQYEPEKEKPIEVSAPSFFGSNRGVNNQVLSPAANADIGKSFGSHAVTSAINSPLWLADVGNLVNSGLQTGYEYYRDISGQPLSLAKEKQIESYQPFYGSDKIGMSQIYEPKTGYGDISGVIGDVTGFTGAASLGDNLGASMAKKPPPMSKDEYNVLAKEHYDIADNVGAVFKPNITNDWIGEIDAAKPEMIAGKLLTKKDQQFINSVDEYKALIDQPLTLRDVDRIDKSLSTKIDEFMENGKHTHESKKLIEIQDKLRDMTKSAGEADIIGGTEGLDALAKARHYAAQGFRMGDIERIFARAETMDNPDTAIRTGFRQIMMNPRRFNGYTAKEKALIKAAASGSTKLATLRLIGRGLNPLIAGVSGMGLPGVAAVQGAGLAARSAAGKVQMRRAMKVAEEVGRRPLPATSVRAPKPELPPEVTKLLTEGEGRRPVIADKNGQSRPMTDEEWQNHISNNIEAANTGITPDVISAQEARKTTAIATRNKRAQELNNASQGRGASELGQEVIAAGNPPLKSYPENIAKDESGSFSTRGAIASGLAGTATLAAKPDKNANTTRMFPAKYKTIDELLNSLPEMKPEEIPQSFKSEEGTKTKVYKDTRGNRTIGTGFNMDSKIARDVWKQAGIDKDFNDVRNGKESITPDEAQKLLVRSYNIAQNDIKKLVPNVDKLSPKAQESLTHLAYQHGLSGLKEALPGVITSAKMGNMTAAAGRLLASSYGKTYKNRATRLARMMVE